jgi:spore maturation protein CgeB
VSARASVWVVARPHYIGDYARAFERRGFATELVRGPEVLARLAGPGDRPRLLMDSAPLTPLHPAVREAGVAVVNLPFDQWYFSPRIALPPCEPLAAEHLVFTLAPEQVAPFRAAGYAHVEHLLFGVDPEHFDDRPLPAAEAARHHAEVCFVGSSLRDHEPVDAFTQALRRSPDNAGLRAWLGQMLERVVPFDYRLPEILLAMEAEAGVSIGDTADLTPAKESWCILGGIKLSELERLEVVHTLSRFDFALYGPSDWRQQLAGHPTALRRYRGELDWATELAAGIKGASVNVNVSKAMFPTGVCPRVFETLACGRLLLTNPIPAVLETFEEGRELVVYRSCAELADLVRHYLAHPDAAERIGQRGRAAVVARHSVQARVDRIVTVLEDRGLVARTSRR